MGRLSWLGALVPYAVLALQSPQHEPAAKVTFRGDVLPILKGKCISCHAGAEPRADLDVTDFKQVRALVEPGAPEKSVLLDRIKGLWGRDQMPLGFAPLAPEQIAIVEAWIKQGASEGEPKVHWAYRPLVKPPVPKLSSKWIRNSIDAFVLVRLQREGLEPSQEAAPGKLLRRLSLDLIGLPPTWVQLDRIESGADTYEAMISKLLDDPRYGERMATPWLDLARYADSNGYEKDGARSAWKYRDWVVNAFNRNLPYDKFTIEQLAGDLLPKPTIDQLAATGFNRGSMLNLEGGVDQDEAMFEVRNDRTAVTSMVWLGQTLACARCHDHKYDPFTQKDYYRFYAFFANNKFDKVGDASISEQKYIEPSMPVPSPEQQKQLASLDKQMASAGKKLAAKAPQARKEQVEWDKLARSISWKRVSIQIDESDFVGDGQEITAQGEGPDTETYHLHLDVPAGTRSLRLEALPAPGRVRNGPGRADSGNFILSKATVKGAKILFAKADFVQDGFSDQGVLDDDPETGWAVQPAYGKPHEMIFELDHPVSGKVDLTLEFGSKRWIKHTLAHFAVSASDVEGGARFAVPHDIQALLDIKNRTPQQQETIDAWFAGNARSNIKEREEIAALRAQRKAITDTLPTTLVMEEANGKTEAPIRHRGEFMSPTELVSSGTPAALGNLAAGNRLSLARWIVSPKNPLAARVEVNRIWELLFGRGLVETSENFGTQGSPPSHPELLDWLACEYIKSGWDTKKLIRLIVSSSTYRQSSAASKELIAKDKDNILLARGPRFRMTAEMIHDSTLFAAGTLSSKMGGPPVFPYQPDGVWDSPYNGEKWMPSSGEDAHRRAIYTYWKRTAPYPSFLTLDSSSREQCTVRRIRTNTPLQALALMNDPARNEAAEALGKRMSMVNRDPFIQGFKLVLSREPTAQELKLTTDFFTKVQAKQGSAAAWTAVGSLLLNLDEAITIE